MKTFLRKIFRKKPVSISLDKNFPTLYRSKKDFFLHEPISAIIGGIGAWLSTGIVTLVPASIVGGAGITVSAWGLVSMVLIGGTTIYSMAAGNKAKSPTALNTHGLQINMGVTYVFYRGGFTT